jgi:nitroreductase
VALLQSLRGALRRCVSDVTEAVHAAEFAAELIARRQTVLPKRLVAPGPDAAQVHSIVGAAAHAPDHGQLLPWRFINVPEAARAALGEVFAQSLFERDPLASAKELSRAREKAFRAPLLLLAVLDAAKGDASIDLSERTLSAGCAIQNLLLMATALGFGSALTSGKALKAEALRRLFDLKAAESALCFISVGTVSETRPARARPVLADYLSELVPPPPATEILS